MLDSLKLFLKIKIVKAIDDGIVIKMYWADCIPEIVWLIISTPKITIKITVSLSIRLNTFLMPMINENAAKKMIVGKAEKFNKRIARLILRSSKFTFSIYEKLNNMY